MSVKQDLRDMTTSAQAIAYYNTYIGLVDRDRLKVLRKTISDAEEEQ